MPTTFGHLWDNFACAQDSQNSDYYHKVHFLFSQLIVINREIILPDTEKNPWNCA